MINFNTFLTEAVGDDFLYHGTNSYALETIVPSDMIEARSLHYFRKFHSITGDKPAQKYDNGRNHYEGVSLSRSPEFAYRYAVGTINAESKYCVALKFNKRKLQSRFKMLPIDFFNNMRARAGLKQGNMWNEKEDFLLGPLLNMNRYLEEIMVVSSYDQQAVQKLYEEYKLKAPLIRVRQFRAHF